MDLLEKTSRTRIFAGLNGSGKSMMKSVVKPSLLGFYINPDEIEAEIAEYGFLDFNRFGIASDKTEILNFFQTSTLLEKADLLDEAEYLKSNDNKLDFLKLASTLTLLRWLPISFVRNCFSRGSPLHLKL